MVTLLFSFIGCSEDIYENHVHNKPIPLKNNISFEQFKKETGLSKFDTKIKINLNEDTVLNRNADGSYELSDFNIATNIIKRVDFDEKITYTFQIQPVVEVANGHFFNLTMFYDEGWQSIITKLIPSAENTIQLKQGTEEKFEGTMSKLYQSNLPPNSIESCITIFVISTHCTGTGDCASGTCDGCDQCYSSDSYRLCSDTPATTLYINAGPSTGGSNGTGGANVNDPSIPPFENEIVLDPNLTDRSVFDDPNYINQIKASDFYYSLNYSQQLWVNNNLASYNQLIQYQIANNWSEESEQFAEELIDICIENDVELDFNPQQVINNGITTVNQLNTNLQSTYFDVEDGTAGSYSNNIQNQLIGTKTIELSALIDLAIEVVANTQPTFSLDSSGCTSYISNVVVGNTWVQNSMSVTNMNFSATHAQITLLGYINVGISLEGLEFGVKQRRKITFLINKTTGQLCCSKITKL